MGAATACYCSNKADLMQRVYPIACWAPAAGLLAACCFLFSSCATVKESRYAKYNRFEYTGDQPSFYFGNDSLAIFGSWFWATRSRAMPHPSYLPKTARRILRKYSRQHGPILFSTWYPGQKKYAVKGFVPVTRQDVRRKGKYIEPFYISALISEKPFKMDTSQLEAWGRNKDYQFKIYTREPEQVTDSLWVMQAFSLGDRRYYTFISILDNHYGKRDASRQWQLNRFVEDVQRMVTEREEE